ncbi:MAG: hypothetical protein IT423_14875, partial [Pirellulaceae bacterium]|nr:hypothetical protein [Pirellulaceae bacterium]
MKKNRKLLSLALVVALCGATSSAQAQYADIKATFVYKGKAPTAKPVGGVSDPFCSPFKLESEALVVNAANNGIRDVIVFPDAKTFDASKANPAAKDVVAKPVLDNKNCRFEPHVLVIKTGQQLVVTNSDNTGHNANFAFFNNDPRNQQIPAKGKQDFKVEKAEPGPIPV